MSEAEKPLGGGDSSSFSPVATRLRAAAENPSAAGTAELLGGLVAAQLPLHDRVLLVRAWEAQRRYAEGRYLETFAAFLDCPVTAADDGSILDATGEPGTDGDNSGPDNSGRDNSGPDNSGRDDSSDTDGAADGTPADDPAVEAPRRWTMRDVLDEADASDDRAPRFGGALAAYALTEEVRLALGLSPGQLSFAANHVRALAGPYRPARDALLAATISVTTTWALLQNTRTVPPDLLPEVLRRVLPHANTQSTPEFRKTVRRAVTTVLPRKAAAALAAATTRRHVTLADDHDGDGDDGTGTGAVTASRVTVATDPLQARRITLLIDAHALRLRAAARHQVTTALAAARAELAAARAQFRRHQHAAPRAAGAGEGPGEQQRALVDLEAAMHAAEQRTRDAADARTRTYRIPLGAWRVDATEALLEAGTLAARDGQPVTAHGRTVELVVTVTLPTLLGLAQDPIELAGYGSLPSTALTDLRAAATGWLLTLLGPAGNPQASTTYKPGAHLQAWITATRATCAAPHCTTPVAWTQRDHTVAFNHGDPATGGPTTAANLAPLCPGHHLLKTHAGYRTVQQPDGTLTTYTPSGHTYTTPPPKLADRPGENPTPERTAYPAPAPGPTPAEPSRLRVTNTVPEPAEPVGNPTAPSSPPTDHHRGDWPPPDLEPPGEPTPYLSSYWGEPGDERPLDYDYRTTRFRGTASQQTA